jgi:hypothetical protein
MPLSPTPQPIRDAPARFPDGRERRRARAASRVRDGYAAACRDRHSSWATREQARRAVFAYLSYYNRHRLHSTPKHRTPHKVRACYRQPIALAA